MLGVVTESWLSALPVYLKVKLYGMKRRLNHLIDMYQLSNRNLYAGLLEKFATNALRQRFTKFEATAGRSPNWFVHDGRVKPGNKDTAVDYKNAAYAQSKLLPIAGSIRKHTQAVS